MLCNNLLKAHKDKQVRPQLNDTNGGKMENSKKPPVGLKPRYIHDGERIDEILCAIERYTDANMSIPKSWVEELRDLLKANLK